MKVAITVWNGRVSPVFDTAGSLLVVDFDEIPGGTRNRYEVLRMSPAECVRLLGELRIDALVCGAISNAAAALVNAAGLQLHPWVSGDVENVLAAFDADTLGSPRFAMPGCRRMRMQCGRGRRMHRGRNGRSRTDSPQRGKGELNGGPKNSEQRQGEERKR